MSRPPEVWLRGALPGYPAPLMPVAHALIQAREDLEQLAGDVTTERLWARPAGIAAAGYHVRHLAGSLDRLLTYARGETLDAEQLRVLAEEKTAAGAGPPAVFALAYAAIDRALAQLRGTSPDTLAESREVGRLRLPSTVLGLLVHAAEHTARHVGQVITTLKVVRTP